MDDFQDLLNRLKSEPPEVVRSIADESGVPFSTLRKLREDYTTNPRIQTVERLRDYYTRRGTQ